MKKAFCFCLALLFLAGIGGYVFSLRSPSQFCWLVFGSDTQVRVLVRLDGRAVSLEQHREGAAVQSIAHFDRLEDFRPVEFGTAVGRTALLSGITDLEAAAPTKLLEFTVQVKTPGSEFRQAAWVWMASDRDQAAMVPFDGHLNVSPEDKKISNGTLRWEMPSDLFIQRGNKATEFFVNAGTTNNQKNCRVSVCTVDPETNQPLLPKGVHPFADIEFPAKDPSHPPLKRRYALAAVC
jgi:hypothetical protein